jgi:ATP-binding cassette subfamily B protein
VWSGALVSPGEGKDIRIFGLGDWALERIEQHLRVGFDPVWAVVRRVLAGQWREFLVVLGPLGIVYVAVAYDAVRGGPDAAVEVGAAQVAALSGGEHLAFRS